MKKVVFFFVFGVIGISYWSCKHDPILPAEQVSFQTDIVPIIASSCMHSGCHNDTVNPDTHTYNTVADPSISYDMVIADGNIVAGKPHASRIYNAVTGSGEEFMPRGDYPALNDRQLKLLYIWIAQGAKNN